MQQFVSASTQTIARAQVELSRNRPWSRYTGTSQASRFAGRGLTTADGSIQLTFHPHRGSC